MTYNDLDERIPLLERKLKRTNEPNEKYEALSNTCEERLTYSWKKLNVYGFPTVRSIWHKASRALTRKKSFSKDQKHILKNVHGIVYPGETLAIMGPSGAGKTTLLNALTFQSESNFKVEGYRYLNGSFIQEKKVLAAFSAYVEQDPMFFETLTVREHLTFQASVRISQSVPHSQKINRVNEVLKELDLEKCKNTVIGHLGKSKGISGGEMRRLSLASEMLTDPLILFCDEPTSGLDSFIALTVIKLLKVMSSKGKSVICTIHQPSSEMLFLFDKILLLAEGKTVFLGTPDDAIRFFTNLGVSLLHHYNPVDIFLQFMSTVPREEENSRKTINFVCKNFEDSTFGLKIKNEIDCIERNDFHGQDSGKMFCVKCNFSNNLEYKTSWFTEFRALFQRSWLNIIKEPLLVKVRLFQTLLLSFMVGLIHQNQIIDENGVMNINGVLFTFLTNMTFQNMFAVVTVFCQELPIFIHEHRKKMYRVNTYFLSKTLVEIPIFLLVPSLFVVITYYWVGLNSKINHFLWALIVLILVTNVATSFGYFVSCLSPNIIIALSIGPPIIIPLLLFGGFLLNVDTIPKYFRWLSYLSWFRYGNEALLFNQWFDIKQIKCNTSNVTCTHTGNLVLKMNGYDNVNFTWDIISLFLLILFFRLSAFGTLILRIFYKENFQ